MDENLATALADLWARTTGPMWIRLIVQPLVAVVFGVRAGLKNARALSGAEEGLDPAFRTRMLRQAWKDVGLVAIVGGLLDLAFQWIALHAIHPIEMVVVVVLIVLLPYQIVRTVVARVARGRTESE